MFILHLLSKFLRGVSPRSGSPLIPRRLVTESVFRPASTIKPLPVFRRHQLPYHLVQRCRLCPANRPGTPNRPSPLRPVDIGAAFSSSPSPFRQVDIRHGYHHAYLRIGAYKHPHHKSWSRFPVPRYSMACGTRQCRPESSVSLTRRGYRPRSPPGQGIVRGRRFGTKMPVHLTDTCRWRLYDSFGKYRVRNWNHYVEAAYN